MTKDNLDELRVTTIRTLAMDAVQAANSGHPGTPMAMAPVADHGQVNGVLAAGVDVAALALELQRQGADAFNASWDELLHCIARKTDALTTAR